MRKKLDYEYCSASPILAWLGDKWALVVLLKLHENGVIRFNELYNTIPSISEKTYRDYGKSIHSVNEILERAFLF